MPVQYETQKDISNNIYLNELTNIAKRRGLFCCFLPGGQYSFDNMTGGQWFVFGYDANTINSPSLFLHLDEIVNSRNDRSELYFDINIIPVTNKPAMAVHQEVAYKAALLSFLKKCFDDRKKSLPDKMNMYDAIAAAKFYSDAFDSSDKNKRKHHQNNMNIIDTIISTSEINSNPLNSAYRKYSNRYPAYCCPDMNPVERFYSRYIKKHKNKVSALTMMRKADEIKKFCCNCKIADLLIKELYNHQDILFYVSPRSSHTQIKNSMVVKKNRGGAKVRYFLFNKADFRKVLTIYYKILYPDSFRYTLEDLKKRGPYSFAIIYEHDYPIFESCMKSMKIPFMMQPYEAVFDERAIYILFDVRYNNDVVEILRQIASDAEQYKIEKSFVSTAENYNYTVMSDLMGPGSYVYVNSGNNKKRK